MALLHLDCCSMFELHSTVASKFYGFVVWLLHVSWKRLIDQPQNGTPLPHTCDLREEVARLCLACQKG